MKFNEIMQLKNAGFTPDQIMTLTNSEALPSASDNDGTDHAVEPPAPLVESPAEVGEDSSSPTDAGEESKPDPFKEIRDMITAMREENKQLKEMIQSDNIRNKYVPSVEKEDAAAIVAKIIRPDYKERS